MRHAPFSDSSAFANVGVLRSCFATFSGAIDVAAGRIATNMNYSAAAYRVLGSCVVVPASANLALRSCGSPTSKNIKLPIEGDRRSPINTAAEPEEHTFTFQSIKSKVHI